MFNRGSKDTAAVPPADEPSAPTPSPASEPARPVESAAPRSAPPVASVLGSDLLIKGGIEGRGSVQLHGRAWGDVKVERLLVTETAELEGSIEAVVVEVRGRVLGPISARYVKLARGCSVTGDVTYESLAIEEGASIEGACKLSKAARAAAAKLRPAADLAGPVTPMPAAAEG